MLVIVVGSVAKRGAGAISIDFLTKPQALNTGFGKPVPSGIANAIVGSGIIVGLAALMALPDGILAAIYLNEFAPKKLGKRRSPSRSTC